MNDTMPVVNQRVLVHLSSGEIYVGRWTDFLIGENGKRCERWDLEDGHGWTTLVTHWATLSAPETPGPFKKSGTYTVLFQDVFFGTQRHRLTIW